jgi:hypothetical protein
LCNPPLYGNLRNNKMSQICSTLMCFLVLPMHQRFIDMGRYFILPNAHGNGNFLMPFHWFPYWFVNINLQETTCMYIILEELNSVQICWLVILLKSICIFFDLYLFQICTTVSYYTWIKSNQNRTPFPLNSWNKIELKLSKFGERKK